MEFYTTGQAAKICKTSPRTITKWIDTGEMRGFRYPGRSDRKISREAMLDFLKRNGMRELLDALLERDSIMVVGLDEGTLEGVRREFRNRRGVREIQSLFQLGTKINELSRRIVIDASRLGRLDSMEAITEVISRGSRVVVIEGEDGGMTEQTEKIKIVKRPFGIEELCEKVEFLFTEIVE